MEKEFVPYNLSVRLRELGFDEPCLATYHNNFHTIIPIYAVFKRGDYISAPLWQQAARFLNDISNNQINININGKDDYEELCKKFKKAIEDIRDL